VNRLLGFRHNGDMSYSFGDKCTCGHHESNHESIKAGIDTLDNLIEIGNIQHPLLNMSISAETNCKICDCKIFHKTN